MLIIAGSLFVDPAERAAYLAANADAVVQARNAAGCFDFVQAADPIDADRINVYERWDSEESLRAFRGEGQSAGGPSPIRAADVKRYGIASVGDP